MKKICIYLTCMLLMAGAADARGHSIKPLAVKSAILIDLQTGKTLYKQNADRMIQPASLAKIITLYLIFEEIESSGTTLADAVVISEKAVQTEGSKMLFETGAEYGVLDLVKGVAVFSANDAAVALAEHFAGSVEQFVRWMNFKTVELGMKHTHFVNPHGLPNEKQKTNARDMSILALAYLKRFPQYLKIHSLERFTVHGEIFENRNDLLKVYAGTDGLKTGYVAAAGYHIIATAEQGDHRLMAIVMGARTPAIRLHETQRLLDYGFRRLKLSVPVRRK